MLDTGAGPTTSPGAGLQQPRRVTSAPVRVLYVAGSGRSGSTVIDSILGQLDGFFSAGELRYLWQRGLVDNRLCGCGRSFRDCATWSRVMADALAPHGQVDAARLAAAQRRQVRAMRVPKLLLNTWLGRATPRYPDAEILTDVYRSICRCTRARVVVDTSKLPPYGHLVGSLPAVDLFVLHVVRDPRATAFSWQRTRTLRDFGDERLMQRQRPWKSAALWVLWNLVTELLWRGHQGRYLRIRYEDFMQTPEETIRRIAAFADTPPASTPFLGSAEVTIAPTHSVAGNPSRHRTGQVRLEPDAEWTHAMRRRDALLVTLMTWPLLLRHGYRLRSRKKPDS